MQMSSRATESRLCSVAETRTQPVYKSFYYTVRQCATGLRSVILSRYTLYVAYTHDTIQPYTWAQTGRFQLCGAQPNVNCSCSQHNLTENNLQKHKLNELYSWTETVKLHYILFKRSCWTQCQNCTILYSNDLAGHKVSNCIIFQSNDLA